MPPGITGDIGPAGPPPGWKPATVGSGSGSDDDIGIGPAGPPPGWAGRVDKGGEHDSDDERKEAGLPSLPVNSAQDDQGEDGGGGGGTRGPMMPMLPAGVRREDLEKLKAETNKIDWQRLAVEEEEEEEDLLGPVAPGQVTRGYVKASMAAEQRAHLDMLAKVEADEAAKLPKHEDWMSMVPEVKSLGFNLDDAQKNRTFLRREKADRGDISEWTDTPADKARREREKELGIAGFKRKPEAACVVDTATATKHTVEQYNRTVRGKTLVEIHREEQKKKASTGRKAGEVALGQWDRSEITQTRVKDDKAIERVFQVSLSLVPVSFQCVSLVLWLTLFVCLQGRNGGWGSWWSLWQQFISWLLVGATAQTQYTACSSRLYQGSFGRFWKSQKLNARPMGEHKKQRKRERSNRGAN